MVDGGVTSLDGCTVMAAVLVMAVIGLSGVGSLEAVTMPEHPEWGALTGMVTLGANGEPEKDQSLCVAICTVALAIPALVGS